MSTNRKQKSKRYSLIALLSFALSAFGLVAGQSGRRVTPHDANNSARAAEEAEQDDVIEVKTEEVLLPVSVRNSAGRLVDSLHAEDFLVYDNGVRQELTSFNRRRVAAHVILLLDASSSVFSQMKLIRLAAKSFAAQLSDQDRIAVMQFADKVELLQDWTNDINSIEKALDWRYRPGERTTFHDGLYLAAQEQFTNVEGRRIVILLTDGIDTAAKVRATFQQALDATHTAQASVFVVSLTASLRARLDVPRGWRRLLANRYDPRLLRRYINELEVAEENLKTLAESTGGRIFLPILEDDLLPVYDQIAAELRSQYILTYKPRPRVKAGEPRHIRVLVAPGGYDIAARREYIGRL